MLAYLADYRVRLFSISFPIERRKEARITRLGAGSMLIVALEARLNWNSAERSISRCVPRRTPRFNIAPAAQPTRVNLVTVYGGAWRKLRDRRMNTEPLCRHCTENGFVTPAVEVDHIKPKALGGEDTWENTQSLCKACHQDKTREDVKRIRRGW